MYRRLKEIPKQILPVLAVVTLIIISGCGSDLPDPIYYGQDGCAHCTMQISDERFAAELKTAKGKAFKFDAIECMAAYAENHADQLQGARYWVKDFKQPEQWIDASKALFLQSDKVKSPMGMGILATGTQSELNTLHNEWNGQTMQWSEVRKQVQRKWAD
jgi:copper chaperone NosL